MVRHLMNHSDCGALDGNASVFLYLYVAADRGRNTILSRELLTVHGVVFALFVWKPRGKASRAVIAQS
jgi:hypothetical protein